MKGTDEEGEWTRCVSLDADGAPLSRVTNGAATEASTIAEAAAVVVLGELGRREQPLRAADSAVARAAPIGAVGKTVFMREVVLASVVLPKRNSFIFVARSQILVLWHPSLRIVFVYVPVVAIALVLSSTL